MPDVKDLTPSTILLVLQFVAPGALIVYFRSLFVTRRLAGFKDNISLFIALSIIYGFVSIPLLSAWAEGELTGWLKWAVWLSVLVALPMALGTLLGVSAQRGWQKPLFGWLRLQPISPYPTAWDWAFGKTPATYVIVTLDDGSRVAGWFGEKSLAASDLAQRDLFIEETYDLDANGNWTQRETQQAILISGKAIKYVEFVYV